MGVSWLQSGPMSSHLRIVPGGKHQCSQIQFKREGVSHCKAMGSFFKDYFNSLQNPGTPYNYTKDKLEDKTRDPTGRPVHDLSSLHLLLLYHPGEPVGARSGKATKRSRMVPVDVERAGSSRAIIEDARIPRLELCLHNLGGVLHRLAALLQRYIFFFVVTASSPSSCSPWNSHSYSRDPTAFVRSSRTPEEIAVLPRRHGFFAPGP
uniref:Uncharacterized protein n=1 Tax=Sphaerodactylus townsendi TaxID=933632 RepID=A0ACB8EM18_9SAUR